jgi:hypothetical protein
MAIHSTSASDSRIQQMEKTDVTGGSPSEERGRNDCSHRSQRGNVTPEIRAPE